MRKSIRFLCLTLCLLLACSTAFAADYTLPEKMNRQIESGSGVKGAMTLAVAGGSEWLDLLLPFTGSNLQLRYITQGGQFQGQLYALDDQEQQRALTQVYGDDSHMYLRSDLLPGKVLTLPAGGELMDVLLGSEDGNPTIYSAIQQFLTIPGTEWETLWQPALAPYESALELWLTDFASEPSVSQSDSGASSMTLSYVIPADSLKAAMKSLMSQFLQDGTLQALLEPMVSDAQMVVYLNPALGYYYDAIIDALPLTGELTMDRVLSARGEMISTTLTLPLPENDGQWSTLIVEITERETALTLMGAVQTVTLVTQESVAMSDRTTYNGIVRYAADELHFSAAFQLTNQFSTYTDAEDNRSHEVTSWTLTATPDLSHLAADDPSRADYVDFDDVMITASTHYSSRDQYNNPTTLEVTLSAQLPALTLDMAMTLRTTSPWVLSDLPTANADELLTLTPDTIKSLLEEFARNATLTMTRLTTQPASASDVTVTAEPTVVPPAQ